MTDVPTQRRPVPPGEPRLILPFLAGFYDKMRGLSYLLIRVTVGGLLIFHAYISGKLTGDTTIATITASLAKRGLEPAEPLAYVVFFNETILDRDRARRHHLLGLLAERFPLHLGGRRRRDDVSVGPDGVRGRAARRRTLLA